jgi:hypothetical protein
MTKQNEARDASVVSHWVQPPDDEDLGRGDELGRVEEAGDVVVDGLLDGTALLA